MPPVWMPCPRVGESIRPPNNGFVVPPRRALAVRWVVACDCGGCTRFFQAFWLVRMWATWDCWLWFTLRAQEWLVPRS